MHASQRNLNTTDGSTDTMKWRATRRTPRRTPCASRRLDSAGACRVAASHPRLLPQLQPPPEQPQHFGPAETKMLLALHDCCVCCQRPRASSSEPLQRQSAAGAALRRHAGRAGHSRSPAPPRISSHPPPPPRGCTLRRAGRQRRPRKRR